MSSLIAHCSLSYHNIDVDVLDVFAVGIRDGIYNNTGIFATPPLTQVQFQVFIDNYINTRGAYKQGGLAQKGPFQEAKNALMGTLDDYAVYVDSIALGNVNTITTAGFVPTKTGSTEHNPPGQPQQVKVERGVSGQILTECAVVPGAEFYGCIMFTGFPWPTDRLTLNEVGQLVIREDVVPEAGVAAMLGEIVSVFDVNKSRKKKFSGLKPGTTYYFYYYAVNASGVSPISIGENLMCG